MISRQSKPPGGRGGMRGKVRRRGGGGGLCVILNVQMSACVCVRCGLCMRMLCTLVVPAVP